MHLGRIQAPVAVPAPVPGRLDERGPAKDGVVRAGPEGKADLDGIPVLIERARLEINDGERPGALVHSTDPGRDGPLSQAGRR